MPGSASISTASLLFAGLFVLAGASVYSRQIRRLWREGGKVRVTDFGLPELLMSLVLAGFFAMTLVLSLRRQGQGEGEVSIDAVLPSSFLFIAFCVGILAFLHFARRLRLDYLFGLYRTTPLAALGWSVGLVLAAFPLCGVANVITVLALQGDIEPQPLVELFSNVSRERDYLSITKILLSGVIIQPACEELLFRGFFYGAWKRYASPLWAGLGACLLFAAFHASLTAFGGLFVLAVCLNLAYERTGSLLVPIGMHALFNFASLVVIYVQAQITLPS